MDIKAKNMFYMYLLYTQYVIIVIQGSNFWTCQTQFQSRQIQKEHEYGWKDDIEKKLIRKNSLTTTKTFIPIHTCQLITK